MILSPLALGATRAFYLVNFILDQQNGNNGFGDSYGSTTNALEILDYFGALGNVNSPKTQQYLRNELREKFDTNNLNIYDLYYILKSIDILNDTDTEVSLSFRIELMNYIEDLNQTGGGFSPTNKTDSSTMISTFYALEAYSILSNGEFEVQDIHKDWVLNCTDNITGGFKGSISSSTPSLINTYCAILILNRAGAIGELVNKSKTINYIKSFYVSTSSDKVNYGGYLPDSTAYQTLLSSTYYCVKILNILSAGFQDTQTINWIYNRQNYIDGGFVDFGDESFQGDSSIIGSYFALESLLILGGSLDVEIWMVEFNYMLLIILIIIFAVVIGLAILFWRRRKL